MLNRNQREGENNIKLALEHTRQASETTRKVNPQTTFLTKCLREEDKSSNNNNHEKRVLIAFIFMNNSHHRD